jgi:hypothetical protein
MDRIRLTEIISDAREKFVAGMEEKKGMRFRTDDRIIRLLRMDLFHEKNLKQLPTVEQFVEMIDEIWVNKNVNRAVKTAAETDYNYQNREKWYE